MGLNDLRNLDLNTLIGCKLTAQEAFVFLEDLQTNLADAPPQDLSQVHYFLLNICRSNALSINIPVTKSCQPRIAALAYNK
jgi:hypothetical protein